MARFLLIVPLVVAASFDTNAFADTNEFFKQHCLECHDKDTHEGNLDLSSLKLDPANPENFAHWVKVHDRIERGEMPPNKQPKPPAAEVANVLKSLRNSLVEAEK